LKNQFLSLDKNQKMEIDKNWFFFILLLFALLLVINLLNGKWGKINSNFGIFPA